MKIREILAQYEIVPINLEELLEIEGHPPGYVPKLRDGATLPDLPASTIYSSREQTELGILERLEETGTFQLQFLG